MQRRTCCRPAGGGQAGRAQRCPRAAPAGRLAGGGLTGDHRARCGAGVQGRTRMQSGRCRPPRQWSAPRRASPTPARAEGEVSGAACHAPAASMHAHAPAPSGQAARPRTPPRASCGWAGGREACTAGAAAGRARARALRPPPVPDPVLQEAALKLTKGPPAVLRGRSQVTSETVLREGGGGGRGAPSRWPSRWGSARC